MNRRAKTPKKCPSTGDTEALKLALCHAVYHRKRITFTVDPLELPTAINIARDTGSTVTVNGLKLTITPPDLEFMETAPDPFFDGVEDEIKPVITVEEVEPPQPEAASESLQQRKERQREYYRKYYREHREKLLEYQRKHRQEHRETNRNAKRKYYLENREQFQARNKKHYLKRVEAKQKKTM